MKYRKLRIASSVLCGILFLLMIALWVRSYLRYDYVSGPRWGRYRFSVNAYSGWFIVDAMRYGHDGYPWQFESHPPYRPQFGPKMVTDARFSTDGFTAYLPYWVLVTLPACLLPAIWVRRFSLRTLLIGMTAVAILLGLNIWALRGS